MDGISAAHCRAAVGGEARSAFGCYLVVWRAAGVGVRDLAPRQAGHQAGLSQPTLRAGFRPQPRRRETPTPGAEIAYTAVCVRRAGTSVTLADSCLAATR